MALSVTLAPCTHDGYVLAGSGYKGPAALIRFAMGDGSLGRPIPIGPPGPISISPNGSMAYVANSGGLEGLPAPTGTTVTPVDLATGRRLPAIGVGGQPGGIAVTPSGSTVLVALRTNGSVVPISTVTRRVGRPIRLPPSLLGQTVPGPITVDPQEDIALVGNLQVDLGRPANVINVINLRTLRPESPISLGGRGDAAGELVISHSGRAAFAFSVFGATTVDLADRTVGPPVPNTYRADAADLSTDGRTLYICQELQTSGSELVRIDSATATSRAGIATFSGPVADMAIGR
jgi:hypothetical protein